uniref:Uncharacterized protein n=1 Tax=Arundo donax TaxID=35708 RepID=A0A0A9CS22_ARUDO
MTCPYSILPHKLPPHLCCFEHTLSVEPSARPRPCHKYSSSMHPCCPQFHNRHQLPPEVVVSSSRQPRGCLNKSVRLIIN